MQQFSAAKVRIFLHIRKSLYDQLYKINPILYSGLYKFAAKMLLFHAFGGDVSQGEEGEEEAGDVAEGGIELS